MRLIRNLHEQRSSQTSSVVKPVVRFFVATPGQQMQQLQVNSGTEQRIAFTSQQQQHHAAIKAVVVKQQQQQHYRQSYGPQQQQQREQQQIHATTVSNGNLLPCDNRSRGYKAPLCPIKFLRHFGLSWLHVLFAQSLKHL